MISGFAGLLLFVPMLGIAVLALCFIGLMAGLLYYRQQYNRLKNQTNQIALNPSYPEIVKTVRNQEFLVNFTNYLNSAGSFENKFKNAMKILGIFSGVSRVFIFEDYGNGKMTRNTFEWCCDGLAPTKDQHQRIAYKLHLADWRNQLLKDGIICASDVQTLPEELVNILKYRNVKSLLVFPLFTFNDFYGFLGFETSESKREWDDMEIGFLKTISMNLSNAFERRITHEEIINSETKFKDLFNRSSDAIFIYNLHGDIEEVNNRACEVLEISKAELLARNIEAIFPKDKIPAGQLYKNDNASDISLFDCDLITHNNLIIPVEINSRPLIFNNRNAMMCVAHDISERKKMEREILSAIIQTEEKERGRLARDLHDGLGPLLSSLKLYVKVLGSTNDKQKREEMLRTTHEVIDESMGLIKEVSNNLSPHVLNDFGLASAIQSFCKKITLTKAIDIKFDSNVFDLRFETNAEIVLFRVLKELVNNTIKHALASRIEIFLLRTGPQLTLIYSDNGIGFDIQRVLDNRASGMGISNIVNRIGSVNGKLMFESQAEKGIQIKIEIALKK